MSVVTARERADSRTKTERGPVAAPLTPEQTHTEIWTDPQGLYGKQDSLSAYQEALTRRRDSTDPYPIRVKIRTPDKRQGSLNGAPQGESVVSDDLPVQLLRDAIDTGEWAGNCFPSNGDSEPTISKKLARGQRIHVLLGGSAGESSFAFTERFQAQLLDIFPSGASADDGSWPETRANLLGLLERDGSRAEELTGFPQVDVNAAQEYGLSLEPPQDLTKKP